MSSSSEESSSEVDYESSSEDYDFFGEDASFWESYNPDEKEADYEKDVSIYDEVYEEDNFDNLEVLEASKANDIEGVKRLINKGFDVNSCNTFILFHAISWGNFGMVEFLLNSGAKRDCAMNIPKISPLNQAIRMKCIPKRWEMVRLLMEYGVSVKDDEHLKESYVHEAIYRSDVYLVKLLFDAGADVNRINFYGEAPIHVAVFELDGAVRLKMIKQLIKVGADVNIKDSKKGLTCLHWVAKQNSDKCELTRIFLEAGAQINCVSNDGTTPLALAASFGDCELMKVLIDAGANVNFTKILDNSALALAIKNNRQDAVNMLLECGADINTKSVDGKNDALSCAAVNVDKNSDVTVYLEILKMLIAKSAFKSRSESQKSIIFRDVLRAGTSEAVYLFIENGIKLEKCGISFPLHEAARNSNAEILELLLKTHLYDVDELDNDESTALFTACLHKNSECVRLLLEWGADVEKGMEKPDSYFESPLQVTVFKRHRATLDLLLSVGARPRSDFGDEYEGEFYVDTRERSLIHDCLVAQLILFPDKDIARIDPDLKLLRLFYSSKFVDRCLDELDVMKTHVLCGSVTLRDFIEGTDVTRFMNSTHAIDKFSSLDVIKTFPIYGKQLSIRFSMACVKKAVMDEAVQKLNTILGVRFGNCHLIFRNIMLRLSMKDLRNLCHV